MDAVFTGLFPAPAIQGGINCLTACLLLSLPPDFSKGFPPQQRKAPGELQRLVGGWNTSSLTSQGTTSLPGCAGPCLHRWNTGNTKGAGMHGIPLGISIHTGCGTHRQSHTQLITGCAFSDIHAILLSPWHSLYYELVLELCVFYLTRKSFPPAHTCLPSFL